MQTLACAVTVAHVTFAAQGPGISASRPVPLSSVGQSETGIGASPLVAGTSGVTNVRNDMPELACPSCGGSGQQSIPQPMVDDKGRPYIQTVITTCHTCKGNGKVQV